MEKRIFIGIEASQNIKNQVSKVKNNYRDIPLLRWIKDRNLHITLLPPWYEENLEEIRKKLKNIKSEFKPFTLKFSELKLGPTSKSPRLIWAEGETSEELNKLQRLLEKSFKKLPEKREFKLHLTLARFKFDNFAEDQRPNIYEKILWIQKVNSITLFESVLRPSGAEYIVISRIKF